MTYTHPSTSIFRESAFWLGLAVSLAIAVVVGTQRTQSGPSWWLVGVAAAALALLVGVLIAVRRIYGSDASSNAAQLIVGTSVLVILPGLVLALVASHQTGVIETVKATCLMYGFGGLLVGALLWVLSRAGSRRASAMTRTPAYSPQPSYRPPVAQPEVPRRVPTPASVKPPVKQPAATPVGLGGGLPLGPAAKQPVAKRPAAKRVLDATVEAGPAAMASARESKADETMPALPGGGLPLGPAAKRPAAKPAAKPAVGATVEAGPVAKASARGSKDDEAKDICRGLLDMADQARGQDGAGESAERMYLQIIELAEVVDPYSANWARISLAEMEEEAGEHDAAERYLVEAMRAAGKERPGPIAALRLGFLRMDREDLAGAADAFGVAVASGDSGCVGRAAFGLAAVREAQGDLAGAVAALEIASGSDDPEIAERAAAALLERRAPAGGTSTNGNDEVLASLRTGNRHVPSRLSYRVSRSFTIDDLTDPGETVHILHDVNEPTRSYQYGLMVQVDHSATTLVLAGSDERTGQMKVFTPDGGVSEQAPFPPWSADGWEDLAIALTRAMLGSRNNTRNNAGAPAPGRIRAPGHAPLQEFMRRSGHSIGFESWRIASRDPFPGVSGAWLEIWTGVLAAGPITYGWVAAAYTADGAIAGLAAVEAAPSLHQDLYFCLFAPDGNHRNFGLTSMDQDFPSDAARVLLPLLETTERPQPTLPAISWTEVKTSELFTFFHMTESGSTTAGAITTIKVEPGGFKEFIELSFDVDAAGKVTGFRLMIDRHWLANMPGRQFGADLAKSVFGAFAVADPILGEVADAIWATAGMGHDAPMSTEIASLAATFAQASGPPSAVRGHRLLKAANVNDGTRVWFSAVWR